MVLFRISDFQKTTLFRMPTDVCHSSKENAAVTQSPSNFYYICDVQKLRFEQIADYW